MIQKAKQYLEENLSKTKHYLLGLSGGPDSTALFSILVEGGYNFRVCHIDHGWREESGEEAKILKRRVEEKGISFHSFRIDSISPTASNLEDKCREKRLEFFKEIYLSFSCEGLILGHQKNDQCETILKRFFESSSLSHLSGMNESGDLMGMKIYRPLLSTAKNEILAYLHHQNVAYFIDSTNENTKFLRARMRKEIVPLLEEKFGKGIEETLIHFGKEMKRVSDHLDKKILPIIEKGIEGPFGVVIDLRGESLTTLELEHLLRKVFERREVAASREEIERLISIIEEERGGKGLIKGDEEVLFERGSLFFVNRKKLADIKITESDEKKVHDWKDVWRGKNSFFIPYQKFSIEVPGLKLPSQETKKLKKFYSEKKVPIVLRDLFPVVCVDGRVVMELLTGSSGYEKEQSNFDLNQGKK